MPSVSVWWTLLVFGGVLLLLGFAAADGTAPGPPDAVMLLDLDLLREVDLAKQKGMLRWLSLLTRLRLLEHLDLFEAAPPPEWVRAEGKK